MTHGVPSRRRGASDRSPIENALRYIGGQRSGHLAAMLQNATAWPTGDVGVALLPLTQPTRALAADWTPDERAAALELLLKEGVEHPSVGPSEHSRERRVLRAALRLPDPDINVAWAATLAERWEQLRVIEQLFPRTSTGTTQPMESAWTKGVRLLANYLERRFDELATPSDWQSYKASKVDNEPVQAEANRNLFRKPSDGAQPFVVNRMVVTVIVTQRNSRRRITERVVTAQEKDVEFYLARAFTAGRNLGRTYVPTISLWGCRAEPVPSAYPGEPITTRLHFPHPLRLGEQAYFASEALYDGSEPSVGDERNTVGIDIDHHGIEAGAYEFGKTFPLRGLTIRVKFEQHDLPRSVWWYAEANELEREQEPVSGNERLLPIVGGEVSYTFRNVCQPRESYGIGFVWT